MRETGVPIGLLCTDERVRLIHAPKGESSGYVTFEFSQMALPAGQPILAALDMLLSADALFSGHPEARLPALLAKSRDAQTEVSTRLSRQVLAALHELLRGFVSADARGVGTVTDIARRDPDHLYGGLITTLMRLVFVLYAEDRGLMPDHPVYQQHYSLGGLFVRLRADAAAWPDTMDRRRLGAVAFIVPRFDPHRAWAQMSSRFGVRLTTGRSIAVASPKRTGAAAIVDLDSVLELEPGKRAKALQDATDRKLTGNAAATLRTASTVADVVAALERTVDRAATPDVVAAGTPVLQPTDERRRSGSHYTPRSLTEPIVSEALRPILERLGPDARPENILDLKVLDPATGSGAFLVESCRQLSARLVEAWSVHGGPPDLPADEDELLHARRLVAQQCIYGVDKNPMAIVNIRCTGVGRAGHSRIGVLRNEVWEGSGGNARGCTAACRRELAELRREVLEERRQARYYRRMHGKAVEREQRLKSELQAARAKLELRQRLRERWARRRGSEKRTRSAGTEAAAAAPRRRGQQRGAPGHGRRQHGHLPVQVEAHDVDPQRRRCPACGDEYRAHGSEDSEQLEIEVRAYRRVIKRRRYRRSCQCAAAPALLTAPPPSRLIPKGILGTVLIDVSARTGRNGPCPRHRQRCVVWRRCSRRCGRR